MTTTRVRAKLRCMQVTHTWEGLTLVKLMPVMGQKGNCEENQTFWKYTPSGECNLTFRKGEVTAFTPGAFYYVDFEATDTDRAWRVSEKIERTQESGRVSLEKLWDNGHPLQYGQMWLELSQRRTFELYGSPGAFWQVGFSDAPAD